MATAMSLAHLEPFRLGAVEVRPATREVLGPEGREVIEPRIMQVLVTLARAEGEVVSRDRLVRECWDGRAVSEDAINRAIQRIRRLSEGVAAGAFTVKTIHKVGYRLLAAPDGKDCDPDSKQVGITKPEVKRTELSRRGWLAGAGVLAAAGTGYWLLRRDPDEERAAALVAQADQVARGGVPETDAQAAALLEQAVRLQPRYAEAWGKLALARTYMAEFASPARTTALVAGVQDASRRALAINPRQPDAHAALAILPPYFGDWLAAERRMKRVLEIAPEHPPTRDALNFMYVGVGRVREGCTDRLRMAAIDPLHATNQFKLILSLWLLGRIAECDRAADRALHLWPKHAGIYLARFYTYALTGRPERALDQLDSSESRPMLPPPMVQAIRAAAVALASRRPADAEKASQALIGTVARNSHAATNAITLLGGLRHIDGAFAVADAYLLERGPLMASVRWRENGMPLRDQRRRNTIALFIPSTAGMRADPRFATLVAQVGLADYWRAARVTPDYLKA
jgi:DNA-binding winged helix-turn-helix (wHTH) protein/tetratricopeptide (TPR) repeat protein